MTIQSSLIAPITCYASPSNDSVYCIFHKIYTWMCCALLSCGYNTNFWWNHMTYIPIFFKLGQWEILKNIKDEQNITIYDTTWHHKAMVSWFKQTYWLCKHHQPEIYLWILICERKHHFCQSLPKSPHLTGVFRGNSLQNNMGFRGRKNQCPPVPDG